MEISVVVPRHWTGERSMVEDLPRTKPSSWPGQRGEEKATGVRSEEEPRKRRSDRMVRRRIFPRSWPGSGREMPRCGGARRCGGSERQKEKGAPSCRFSAGASGPPPECAAWWAGPPAHSIASLFLFRSDWFASFCFFNVQI
jgi:hypothetical protein